MDLLMDFYLNFWLKNFPFPQSPSCGGEIIKNTLDCLGLPNILETISHSPQ